MSAATSFTFKDLRRKTMIKTTKAQIAEAINSTVVEDKISGRFLQLPPNYKSNVSKKI